MIENLSEKCRKIREWMKTLLRDDKGEPFTPELDEIMQELWRERENAIGEHKAIVYAFETVIAYQADRNRFTPYYYEKEDRLAAKWLEIQKRVQELV